MSRIEPPPREQAVQQEEPSTTSEKYLTSCMANQAQGSSTEVVASRREKIALAAERRRSCQSPYSTPPHDTPPSPDDKPSPPKSLKTLNLSQPEEGVPTASVTWKLTEGSSYKDEYGEVIHSEDGYSVDGDVAKSRLRPKRLHTTSVLENTVNCTTTTSNLSRVRDDEELRTSCSQEMDSRPSTSKQLVQQEIKSYFQMTGLAKSSKAKEYGSPTLLGFSAEIPSVQGRVQQDDDVAMTKPECRGLDLGKLNRTPACLRPLPALQTTPNHVVLFRPHIQPGKPPRPYPDDYHDAWDTDHVRMPCSAENLYPVEDETGAKRVQSRWDLIQQTLQDPIHNSNDLEEAILTYNARYCHKWNFAVLHYFLTQCLDKRETADFFHQLLPQMVQLALSLPKTCTQAIPLLRRHQNRTITLTQLQAASLMANAFFCTFPRRNTQQKKSEYSSFPDINLNRLFAGSPRAKVSMKRKVEKLKCIINYFKRVTSQAPTGTISFTRRILGTMPVWETSQNQLSRFHGNVHGRIEDEGEGLLQVDFANMFVGGGVLGQGLVQEEIRFLLCPELIVSRLFTEVLDANECLVIKGVERFNNYTGYSDSFAWTGNHQDKIQRDSWGRKETEIVAIDALVFHRFEDQFKPSLLRRELNKAYCGFHGDETPAENLSAVATGNWGCGAFGGDPRLKGLLQMMVAAECHRDVAYFTFGDEKLCYDLHKMHEFLVSQAVTVGDIWLVIQRYYREVVNCRKENKPNLYTFIYQVYYSDSDFSMDEDEASETEFDEEVTREDTVTRTK